MRSPLSACIPQVPCLSRFPFIRILALVEVKTATRGFGGRGTVRPIPPAKDTCANPSNLGDGFSRQCLAGMMTGFFVVTLMQGPVWGDWEEVILRPVECTSSPSLTRSVFALPWRTAPYPGCLSRVCISSVLKVNRQLTREEPGG